MANAAIYGTGGASVEMDTGIRQYDDIFTAEIASNQVVNSMANGAIISFTNATMMTGDIGAGIEAGVIGRLSGRRNQWLSQ